MTTTTNPIPLQVNTGAIPQGGRMAIPYQVDLTSTTAYTIDFTSIQQMQNRIGFIQGAFIDNSGNTSSVLMTMANTGQKIVVPASSQAYLPLVITNQATLVVSSSGGVIIPFQFFNFSVAPMVWSTIAPPSTSSGTLAVSDAVLEAGVISGVYQTAVAGNKTYTSVSGTIAAGGASQSVVVANASRSCYRFQNTSTGTLWLNDNGGAAGVNVGDSLEIPAGGLYETQPGLVSNKAIAVFGATTGQQFVFLWA